MSQLALPSPQRQGGIVKSPSRRNLAQKATISLPPLASPRHDDHGRGSKLPRSQRNSLASVTFSPRDRRNSKNPRKSLAFLALQNKRKSRFMLLQKEASQAKDSTGPTWSEFVYSKSVEKALYRQGLMSSKPVSSVPPGLDVELEGLTRIYEDAAFMRARRRPKKRKLKKGMSNLTTMTSNLSLQATASEVLRPSTRAIDVAPRPLDSRVTSRPIDSRSTSRPVESRTTSRNYNTSRQSKRDETRNDTGRWSRGTTNTDSPNKMERSSTLAQINLPPIIQDSDLSSLPA